MATSSRKVQAGLRPTREKLVAATCDILAAHGYEPRRHDGTVTLANCPFHALSSDHTDLVCGMNLALMDAVVARLGESKLTATLDSPPAAAVWCSRPADAPPYRFS